MSSDVVRNYTWGGSLRKRRRDLRRRGRGVAKFVLPALALLLLWSLWLTRDTHDMTRFIPADRQVEVYVSNIVARRADIARSRIWELIPKQTEARRIVDTLFRELPIPEWLLNNLSADICHISGPGFEPGQMLAITRMTRIGCVAERLVRLTAPVKRDYAGGLRMRHVPEAGLYYAVRGRVLLLSLSRDSLVRALTLLPEETLGQERFQDGARMAGGADVYCRVDAHAWTLPEEPFERLSFALRIEPDAARLVVHGSVSPAFQHRFAAVLQELGPRKLPAPLDGLFTVSADLGRPLPELVQEVVGALDGQYDAWTSWRDLPETEDDTLGPITDIQTLILHALRNTGPRMRLAWFGVDANEMVPAPLLAATFNARTDAVLALFERIAPPPPGNVEFDLAPRMEEELLLAHAPFIGGPSIEPTVAAYGGGLIIASSLPLTQVLQESPLLGQDYHQEGNLYAALKPMPAFEACMDAVREFAASGLLRDHTEQTIEGAADAWRTTVAAMNEIALIAAYDQGDMRAELKLSLREQPAAADNNAE